MLAKLSWFCCILGLDIIFQTSLRSWSSRMAMVNAARTKARMVIIYMRPEYSA